MALPYPRALTCTLGLVSDLYTWVYQYEMVEARLGTETVRHTTFRTRDSILAKGGTPLSHTARQVRAYEVDTSGMWKPDRNPVT